MSNPMQRPAMYSELIPILPDAQLPGLDGASLALRTEFNKLPKQCLIKSSTDGSLWYRGGTGDYASGARLIQLSDGSGGGNFTAPVNIVVTDGNNNGTVDVLNLEHDTTGTAGDGIGVGQAFYLQDDSGSPVGAGRITVNLTDAAAAAPISQMLFWTLANGGGLSPYALRTAASLSYGSGVTTFRLGINHEESVPGDATIEAPSASGTDASGSLLLINGSLGTGNGTPGTVTMQVGVPVGAGTAQQVFIPALSHVPVGTSPNVGVRADFGGGLRLNRVGNAATTNITVREYNCIIGITAAPAASRTVALPTPGTTAGTAKAGAVIIIQDEFGGLTSTNTLVISSAGSTIDGAATLVMGVARSAVTLVSTGDATLGWKIASFFSPTTHAVSTAGGNVTLDARTGRFRINNGQTAVTITNATVQGATSTILLSRYAGFDATLLYVTAVASAGSFLVTGNAAATTANTDWQFEVINPIA